MEVMPRSPEFHFTTASNTTFPSSPPLFGEPFNYQRHFTSAPSSPTRAAAAIYPHFSSDFSFSSGDTPEISTADKLFEKGKIRPLHHPPPIAAASSPQSGERGRRKNSPASNFGNRSRETRSLSPLRNHSFFIQNSTFTSSSSSATATAGVGGGNWKWRLKDLLLFRSASEGRATGRGSRDPLRKYTLLSSFTSFSSKSKKKGEEEEDSKCGSFRSTESCGGSMRRAGGQPASAHEIHYTANRAAAGEKRKKTPLPYQRQGLFSCLQFNPAIRSITKGFNSFS
ncbi:hypothetical protein KFK09_019424 [Dendrobium nobile]|uniref:Uncharacterized protein n=1 Tax=Dendrobium nobile TaxID=94219 RepID=A0A8T3APG8_DENNO|nr:hypothetical protein KFK09_019424 [Dendrobium nobile]